MVWGSRFFVAFVFWAPADPTYWPVPRYQAALLGSLACMETIMNSQPRVMDHDSCSDFKKAYLTYRSSLNWLAMQSIQASRCRYRLRPKCHQPAHLVYSYLPLNPRKFANYLDEDFIFKTKKVAEKAHPLWMPTHVAMKYSIAVCLRWWSGPFWRPRKKIAADCSCPRYTWQIACWILCRVGAGKGRARIGYRFFWQYIAAFNSPLL